MDPIEARARAKDAHSSVPARFTWSAGGTLPQLQPAARLLLARRLLDREDWPGRGAGRLARGDPADRSPARSRGVCRLASTRIARSKAINRLTDRFGALLSARRTGMRGPGGRARTGIHGGRWRQDSRGDGSSSRPHREVLVLRFYGRPGRASRSPRVICRNVGTVRSCDCTTPSLQPAEPPGDDVMIDPSFRDALPQNRTGQRPWKAANGRYSMTW